MKKKSTTDTGWQLKSVSSVRLKGRTKTRNSGTPWYIQSLW